MDINNIRTNLRLSGKLRNFRYIKRVMDLGRLRISNTKMTDAMFADFRVLIKHLEGIYGGMWDFRVSLPMVAGKANINIHSVILKFDEIEITNTPGEKHIIEDLLVQIRISTSSDKLYVNDLSGNRLTITQKELESNYFHSHLDATRDMIRRDINSSYTSFCTGSGEINAYRMEINSDGFTDENVIKFLLQINTLVSWESLEGTPYRKMRDIFSTSSSVLLTSASFTMNASHRKNYYQAFLNEMRESGTLPKIQFNYSPLGYSVKESDDLDMELRLPSLLLDSTNNNITNNSVRNKYFCLKNARGSYFSFATSNSVRDIDLSCSSDSIIFRGEYIGRKVIPTQNEEEASQDIIVVKPELKKYLINTINNDINKKAIRQSTIDRYKS